MLESSRTPFNASLVRQAYMNALNSTARLTAYCLAGRLVDADEEVAEHCRELAADDLVLLCISLRRLIEATDLKGRAQNVWVSNLHFAAREPDDEVRRADPLSLWQLLGIVVHSRVLDIVDRKTILAMRIRPSALDALARRARDKPAWIDPICFAKSDQSSVAFFLNEFSLRVAQLLKSVREVCDDEGLFLSVWLRD